MPKSGQLEGALSEQTRSTVPMSSGSPLRVHFTETTRKEEEKSGGFEVEDPQGTLLDFSDLTAQNAISQLVFI